MHLFEKQIDSEILYEGKIINLRKDTAELENGKTAPREVVEHPGGVCVLPVTEDGHIYLVKQFRYPFQEVLLEAPAGKMNYGEDPFKCGVRELKEETGAEAGKYTDLGVLYPSVAYLTEKIYMYMAQDLTFDKQKLDDDEFLDVVKMPLKEALEMVMKNEIRDAKTQLIILKTVNILK